MDGLKNIRAVVDFVAPHPLPVLAQILSESLFGGIEFVGLDDGVWDEVPAMKLKKRFLCLEVELGGRAGDINGYTLQVLTEEFPWEKVKQKFPELSSKERSLAVAYDISGVVAEQLKRIDGVELRPATY